MKKSWVFEKTKDFADNRSVSTTSAGRARKDHAQGKKVARLTKEKEAVISHNHQLVLEKHQLVLEKTSLETENLQLQGQQLVTRNIQLMNRIAGLNNEINGLKTERDTLASTLSDVDKHNQNLLEQSKVKDAEIKELNVALKELKGEESERYQRYLASRG